MTQCCPMDTYDTDSAGDLRPVCTCGDGCECMCLDCACRSRIDDDYWDDDDFLAYLPAGRVEDMLRNPDNRHLY